MRLHIELDDELVREVDRLAGRRERGAFIRQAVQRAVDDARRFEPLTAAAGALAGRPHFWDADPATWVQAGRRGDARRGG